MTENLYEEYISILKEKKVKLTEARLAILKCISTKKHFTINELISEVEKELGNVNVMSVYNNIDLLLDLHLIFSNTINGKQIIYEAIAPQLIHIKCHECGSYDHLESSSLTQDLLSQFKTITSSSEFELEHFKLEMHGVCKNCRK
ncbi:Fur family transcriptional regulator [Spiroplasma culicicola]|uniref:Fur family transcriptional regulator n=1 Tax=Spiroplasma culicicola AES-1 TaxID=1276246 RepID=W6A7Z1_9MOLU|nr:transcriptional repressor [Spiroplasma culicicola]AHI53238.1 Fur family transcriptional regulator [Spiroplasma culicicola AES-1]